MLFKPETLKKNRKIKVDNYLNFDPFSVMRYTLRSHQILGDNCLICDASEDIVMHHVRHIRKTKVKGFTALMSKLNRKQVAVCNRSS
jgi:hypothetical protein